MTTIEYNNKTFTEVPKGKQVYFISRDGEILSLARPRFPKILKPTVNGNGYYMVGMHSGKDRLNLNVHRALCEVYLPNPDQLPFINHIDGCKLNNSLENLEWCSPKHNTLHAHRTGLASSRHCEVEVHKYLLDGSYSQSYKSLRAAADAHKVDPSNIHVALNNGKVSGGFLWNYSKKDAVEPYTGKPIVDYVLVDGEKFDTVKEVLETFKLSKTSLYEQLRRHGNKINLKNRAIEFIYK